MHSPSISSRWRACRTNRPFALALSTFIFFLLCLRSIDRLRIVPFDNTSHGATGLAGTTPSRPPTPTSNHDTPPPLELEDGEDGSAVSSSPEMAVVDDTLRYFVEHPIDASPYKDSFGELGRRTRIMRDWMVRADEAGLKPALRAHLESAIEKAATTLYPYLRNPPRNRTSDTPFADLRSSFRPGSAGIVIPAGDGTVRYAAHLVASLRLALGCKLPIEIAYAGDKDLSPASRRRLVEALAKLVDADASEEGYPGLEFVDVTAVFDDATLRFNKANGGWAVKSFAVLGSRFEKVIMLDADAVFLQPPEVLLPLVSGEQDVMGQEEEASPGAFLFHDRLLWQHAFPDRHAWWRSQIRERPSATLNRSLVWTQDYAEEADSGVVVVHKDRADVLAGLLHVCWQNTLAVRDEVTYRLTYGDKESWWLGFELARARYDMERHYGGIAGWRPGSATAGIGRGKAADANKVCSFVIAHVDADEKLLWYNGGLLKNKLKSQTDYEMPRLWMVDGTWEKGRSKSDMSCMVGGRTSALTAAETDVLARSIEMARKLDVDFLH